MASPERGGRDRLERRWGFSFEGAVWCLRIRLHICRMLYLRTVVRASNHSKS